MTLAVSLLLSLSTVCASVVRTGDSVVIGVVADAVVGVVIISGVVNGEKVLV